MTKIELRRQFLTLRKSLSSQEVDARSKKISQLFFDQKCMDGQTTVHTFLPIMRQNEVNTWPIIHRIWQDFPTIQVVVSITDIETHQLSHQALNPDTVLVENRWGIPEPVADKLSVISADQLDIVLVPLLTFDQQGHRIGYGGGFYDRFLATCRPDCLKIGLSLFDSINQIDDPEQTDIQMNMCITADQICIFK